LSSQERFIEVNLRLLRATEVYRRLYVSFYVSLNGRQAPQTVLCTSSNYAVHYLDTLWWRGKKLHFYWYPSLGQSWLYL